jgi:hypothetical protein
VQIDGEIPGGSRGPGDVTTTVTLSTTEVTRVTLDASWSKVYKISIKTTAAPQRGRVACESGDFGDDDHKIFGIRLIALGPEGGNVSSCCD